MTGVAQFRKFTSKGIPLHTLAAIIPAVGNRARFCLVKDMLQDHQLVMPEREILDLAIRCFEMPTSSRLHVE